MTRFLEAALANQARGPDEPSGCLLANCAAESAITMDDVRTRLAGGLAAGEARLEERFAAAIGSGDLDPDPDARSRAALLLDMMQAQAHRARAGSDRAALAAQIPLRACAVLG